MSFKMFLIAILAVTFVGCSKNTAQQEASQPEIEDSVENMIFLADDRSLVNSGETVDFSLLATEADTPQRTIFIRNKSSGNLTLDLAAVDAALLSSTIFSKVSSSCSTTLRKRRYCKMVVQADYVDGAPYGSAVILPFIGDGSYPLYGSVSLKAAISDDISAVQASLLVGSSVDVNLGILDVGEEASSSVFISNNSLQYQTMPAIEGQPAGIVIASSCSGNILPHRSCVLSFSCEYANVDTCSGIVSFAAGDHGVQPINISVSGKLQEDPSAPDVDIVSPSVDTTAAIGETVFNRIYIRNNKAVLLDVDALFSIDQPISVGSDLIVDGGSCLGQTKLQPGNSCYLDVHYVVVEEGVGVAVEVTVGNTTTVLAMGDTKARFDISTFGNAVFE